VPHSRDAAPEGWVSDHDDEADAVTPVIKTERRLRTEL
jgi:hypothetical protein